ncbi:hypothetical protein IAU60_001893 [Kwoniella sp. DSM 27419]
MSEVVYSDDTRYPGPPSHPPSASIQGLPTQAELDAYPRMFTWGDLKGIIVSGKLEDLMRNKQMQARYNVWMGRIKQRYGSSEKYLKEGRLPFPTGEPSNSATGNDGPSAVDSTASIPSSEVSPSSAPRAEAKYLTFDSSTGFDEENYAVLPNDWPYNIPYGVRHFCVWSRLPITHPSLVDNDPAAWTTIEQEGLGGFTGIIPLTAPERPDFDPSCLPGNASQAAAISTPTASTDSASGDQPAPAHPLGWGATTLAGFGTEKSWYEVDLKFGGTEMQYWAGKEYESAGGSEVGKMVRALWDQRGWECLWFVNPPRLQSVPGLAHFHVFARRKTPEEIDVSEIVWGTGEKPQQQQ